MDWDTDEADLVSRARIEAFLRIPALERHSPPTLSKGTISSFRPPLVVAPLNHALPDVVPVVGPNSTTHHNPAVAPNAVVAPNVFVSTNVIPNVVGESYSTSVATRTRRTAGAMMDKIRAARSNAAKINNSPKAHVIIEDYASLVKLPEEKHQDFILPQSSATISAVEGFMQYKRTRSEFELFMPKTLIIGRAVDNSVELLESCSNTLAPKIAAMDTKILSRFLVASVRDGMYGSLLLGHKSNSLQETTDAHTKIVGHKDATISLLRHALKNEKANSKGLAHQLYKLESVVGELRRNQVENLGRISQLSAAVKELEDSEKNSASY